MITIIKHHLLKVKWDYVYGHLGIEICTFTMFCKNNCPKERNNDAK